MARVPAARHQRQTRREELGFVYVDTGAMYRTLAWHCLRNRIDVHDPRRRPRLRRWKTKLLCIDNAVRLTVDGYYPRKNPHRRNHRPVSHVARCRKSAVMKLKQRECIQFGNLVMKGATLARTFS